MNFGIFLLLLAILCGGHSTPINETTEIVPDRRSDSDICFQRETRGPCKASFVKVYYDHTRNECRSLIYGGCKPFEGQKYNMFDDCEQCQRTCNQTAECVLDSNEWIGERFQSSTPSR
ncbi:Pancreatic trypsin inhibitor-like [Tropilaelaps mercedesae]|uniref:Pancreatic trypsin inhibitor-like n=1 Tax=Tropilaelaps mercedesae TaxID=418985 RepID=A0A1V9WZK0_9ACAR|nr:Pancreatic trypsin inhibitor-like [Tropilaelaps mercedesae]